MNVIPALLVTLICAAFYLPKVTAVDPGHQTTVTTPKGKATQPKDKTTELTTASSKETETEAITVADSSETDFLDDDVWEDIQDPLDEFGTEYDLDPKLLDGDRCLEDTFTPQLELPTDMTQEMFFKPHEQDSAATMDKVQGWFKSIATKVQSFLTPANVKEQLDSIPGTIQTMLGVFRQKKAEALKVVRARMDDASDKVGMDIRQQLAEKEACSERAKQCLEKVTKSFEEYEKALQDSMRPCMEKIQRYIDNHEQRIGKVQEQSNHTLNEMQECMGSLENLSIKSALGSFLNIGSCTQNKLKNKMEEAMKPLIDKLVSTVQQQGDHLEKKAFKISDCVHKQIHLPGLEKQQQQLVDKAKLCLQAK